MGMNSDCIVGVSLPKVKNFVIYHYATNRRVKAEDQPVHKQSGLVSGRLGALVHDIDIFAMAEQAVAFAGGQFADDAETLQVPEAFVDGSRSEAGFLDQPAGSRYR